MSTHNEQVSPGDGPDGTDPPASEIDAGVAGRSTRREFERRKAAREARVKGKLGNRVGGAFLALTDEPQSTRAYDVGAKGEEKLGRALDEIDGARVLHDRRAPGKPANIDHVLVSGSGVFVIDAKRYTGRIEIRNRGNFFRPDRRLYVGGRDHSGLATGLGWQMEAVTSALLRAYVDPLPPITPILCFIEGDWPLFGAPDEFAGVRLDSPKSLRKVATSTRVMDAGEVERLARILEAALPPK